MTGTGVTRAACFRMHMSTYLYKRPLWAQGIPFPRRAATSLLVSPPRRCGNVFLATHQRRALCSSCSCSSSCSSSYHYPVLQHVYRHCSTVSCRAEGDGDAGEEDDDDDDGAMDAYEDLLLNAQGSNEGDEVGGEPALAAASTLVESTTEEVLSLLPEDGAAVKLTSLTPLMTHVEEVCEAYGSVLAFLQQQPKLFACEEERVQGRRWWYVRLSKSRASPKAPGDASLPSASQPQEDLSDMYALEELAALLAPTTTRKGPRSSSSGIGSRTAKTVSLRDTSSYFPLDWSGMAHALPETGTVFIPDVRALLPDALQGQLKEGGRGIARLYREQYPEASQHVDLSADGRWVSRRGQCAGHDVWTPAQHAPSPASAVHDGAPLPWCVDLDLDGDWTVMDSAEGSGDLVGEEAPDSNFLADSSACEVFYEGPTGGRDTKKVKVSKPTGTQAPPAAKKKAAAAPTPKKKKKVPPTPEELMQAHTQMAQQRGWHTPAQMLDLLVECVPTFPVPSEQLALSDALAKVLGPKNTMAHVLRAFPYFFQKDRDAGTACLLSTLTHAQLGMGNTHYRRWDPSVAASEESGQGDHAGGSNAGRLGRRATAATSAFPILKPIIRSQYKTPSAPHVAVPAATTTTTTAPTSTPLRADSGSIFATAVMERMALSLPWDRYVEMPEAIKITATTSLELQQAIAEDRTSPRSNSLFLCLDAPWRVRLRPFYVAPGSTGEVPIGTLPAELLKALQPAWLPIPRVLSRLPPEARRSLQEIAMQNITDNPPDLVAMEKEDSIVHWRVTQLLRTVGRSCWVSADGKCVRRYTANADLDDATHVLIPLLARAASHEMQPLSTVLHKASQDYRERITNNTDTGKSSMCGGLIHLAEHSSASDLFAFLQKHKKILTVQLSEDKQTIHICRRTTLVAFK